jgi:hypothetical protein
MRQRVGKPLRQQDIDALDKLLDDHDGELRSSEVEAFRGMKAFLVDNQYATLSEKQRKWVMKRLEDFVPLYENLVSSGKVPRGKEVQLMVGFLPKRPPQKPKTDD